MHLREALLQLPSRELQRTDLAVIVPAFELRKGPDVASFSDVANSSLFCTLLIRRASKRIPNTKAELNACISKKRCSTFRPKERLHDYFFPQWYDEAYAPLLTRVKCFKGDTQEPYVMVKKVPEIPRFDERFVNYGYNKVQWLEHLRFVGYDFEVLTHGFAVDIPHKKSKYWSTFVSDLFGKKENGKRKTVPMKEAYYQFVSELKRNFTRKQVVGKCLDVCSIEIDYTLLKHTRRNS